MVFHTWVTLQKNVPPKSPSLRSKVLLRQGLTKGAECPFSLLHLLLGLPPPGGTDLQKTKPTHQGWALQKANCWPWWEGRSLLIPCE